MTRRRVPPLPRAAVAAQEPRAAIRGVRATAPRAAGPAARPHRRGRLRRAAGGVEARGRVSRGRARRLYRGAAALVFPSLYEGFGMPVARGDGVRLPGRLLERRRRCPRSPATPRACSTRATSTTSPPPSTTSSRPRAVDRARARARRLFTWDACARAHDDGLPRALLRLTLAAEPLELARRRAARRAPRTTPPAPIRAARAPSSGRRRGRAARPCRASATRRCGRTRASRGRRARTRTRRAPRRCAARPSRST